MKLSNWPFIRAVILLTEGDGLVAALLPVCLSVFFGLAAISLDFLFLLAGWLFLPEE